MGFMLRLWLLCLILCVCSLAYAAPPPHVHIYQLTLGSDVSYYTSNSNYTNSWGNYEELANRKYTNILTNIYGLYGVSEKMNLMASVAWAHGGTKNKVENSYHTSFTDFMGGGQLQLITQPFSLVTELFCSIPLFSIEDTNQALLGEGALAAQAGLWMYKSIPSHIFYLYFAYKFQSNGRASLIPWAVGFESHANPLIFNLEIGGFNVVIKDKYSDSPEQRKDLIRRVNGGHLKYYSVNPEVIEARGHINFQLVHNLRIGLGFSGTLNGRNYARGYTFLAHFQWQPNKFKNRRSKKDILDTIRDADAADNF